MSLNQRMDKKPTISLSTYVPHTFTHWNITQLLQNNNIIEFPGKWMELENIILSSPSPPRAESQAPGAHTLLREEVRPTFLL